jgi:hypothetical protein
VSGASALAIQFSSFAAATNDVRRFGLIALFEGVLILAGTAWILMGRHEAGLASALIFQLLVSCGRILLLQGIYAGEGRSGRWGLLKVFGVTLAALLFMHGAHFILAGMGVSSALKGMISAIPIFVALAYFVRFLR